MLNIVADKEGVGAAVLIRSCAPVSGNLYKNLNSMEAPSLYRRTAFFSRITVEESYIYSCRISFTYISVQ